MIVTNKQRLTLDWQEASRAWDGIPAGYFVATRPDGVEVAQARTTYFDGEEHELRSEIYELVREADQQPTPSLLGGPVSIHAALSPEAYAERIAIAAATRALMKPNQKSPIDMEVIARELQSDGAYKERSWQLEQRRLVERKAASDQAVTFLAQLDPEFLTAEQRAALGKLLSFLLNKEN